MSANVYGNTLSILYHDGVEKFRGTYNECLMKLHNLQGQSWDYAFKYGGWTIEPIKEETK